MLEENIMDTLLTIFKKLNDHSERKYTKAGGNGGNPIGIVTWSTLYGNI